MDPWYAPKSFCTATSLEISTSSSCVHSGCMCCSSCVRCPLSLASLFAARHPDFTPRSRWHGVDPVGLAEPDGSSLLTSSTSRATSQSSPLRLLAPRWNSATQGLGASGTSVVPLAHRPGSPYFTCRQGAVSDNSRRVVHPTHPFFLTYVHHATTTASPTRPLSCWAISSTRSGARELPRQTFVNWTSANWTFAMDF